ncbi:MAG: class I SAM-dependent methyltransferase [Bacteroidia bacterium]|nr:class I SAM-dependent methyltransferase [Bacteroidia bacterium]
MEERVIFYIDSLKRFIPNEQNASILVVAGGKNDVIALSYCGFKNLLITNITEKPLNSVEPYYYQKADALSLPFANSSFDYVIISAALHHLPQPHLGLLEVYRVASKGALVIEAYDNLLMNFFIKCGIAEVYELSAVKRQKNKNGGLNNSEIPNYVFRWNKKELCKTILAFEPSYKHNIEFYSRLLLPYSWELRNNICLMLFSKFLNFIFSIIPSQKNLFSAFIHKPKHPDDLQPWLK